MLILNDIDILKKLFTTWVGNTILDFKIVLLLNGRVEVHFLVKERFETNSLFKEYEALKGMEKLITFYQVDLDEDDDKEWFRGDKVDLGLRRRLTNLIEFNNQSIKSPCPVISFYSYKGGTGRTTALAFFASWLATHHGKKVVVIDCDFEAPGLTNYFDISSERKGIAEYLFDIEYANLKGETLDLKRDYLHQVRYEYVGKGDVFIVPAGNLSNEKISENSGWTNRTAYLEAISRIDITSVNHIVNQFESFFSDLQEQLSLEYENSIILIDSRTGFNDTFGVLSLLSDIIVGFFGINKQSIVGLTQFLESFGTVNDPRRKQIVLVNSISENRNHEQVFKEILNSYASQNEDKFTDEELGKKDFITNVFRIPRREFLGKLGTILEDDDKGILATDGATNNERINLEFYEKIQDPDSEFRQFFNGIHEKIDFLIEAKGLYECQNERIETEPVYRAVEELPIDDRSNVDDSLFDSISQNFNKIAKRECILRTLAQEDKFPKPYADNDIPKLKDFFFRDCMKDFFNRDKFLVMGYKGTGKTHIYQAFREKSITDAFCRRENQNPENYLFVNVIPVFFQKKNDLDELPDETSKYFNVTTKFAADEINKVGQDYFFERFWIAYIWNEIFSHPSIRALNISLSSEPISVNNDNKTADWFRKVIQSNLAISGFEIDLQRLDKRLKELNQILVLSFDQLDFMVKPENWSMGISPLITYWRGNLFSRIYPKIFVRSDIFENRLGNITNINELPEKSISLQWSKQELFAYFFKYVFQVAKRDFYVLSYAYQNSNEKAKLLLLQIENELDSEGQISIWKEDQLRFLVENFFGKYANRYDKGSNYGEVYDWFYRNLTDAKGAISIRPFLDLLHKAISIALEDNNLEVERLRGFSKNKVLSAFYFTSKDATAYAAERYYNDLAKDKGNEPLRFFYQYVKNDGLERDRIYEYTREQLDDLLKRIINFPNYKNEESLKDKSIDDFKNLLVNNGILGVTHITNRQLTRYTIPFLYRSYFAVGSPHRPSARGLKRPRKRRIS
jgi:cellulose biosynthesis protein BcsQ